MDFSVSLDVPLPTIAERMNQRPRSDPLFHWVLLLLSLAVMVAACLLRVGDDGRVYIPMLTEPLPETCMFKQILRLDCPGCGLTRCFIQIARGHPRDAWDYNPAGFLFFAIILAQIPYRAIQIWRIGRQREELRTGRWVTWLAAGSAVLLIMQWIWRLAAGFF